MNKIIQVYENTIAYFCLLSVITYGINVIWPNILTTNILLTVSLGLSLIMIRANPKMKLLTHIKLFIYIIPTTIIMVIITELESYQIINLTIIYQIITPYITGLFISLLVMQKMKQIKRRNQNNKRK